MVKGRACLHKGQLISSVIYYHASRRFDGHDDTKYEGEAKQREVNSLEPECHVSERPQPLIHIEAGVSFLVGILIFRHKRGLFVLAFSSVYAIAFLVFVGLTFPCHSIGREFGGKGTKLTTKVYYTDKHFQGST